MTSSEALLPPALLNIPQLVLLPRRVRLRDWALSWLATQTRQAVPATALVWFNPDNEKISIEMARQLPVTLATSAGNTDRWVILFNLDLASIEAQQALLKTLEEPPAHTRFLITTTNLGRILETIASRCQLSIITTNAIKTDLKLASEIEIPDLSELLQRSHGDLVSFCEGRNDRDTALDLIDAWTVQLHQDSAYPQAKAVKVLAKLQQVKTELATAVTPRLGLENALFQLKSLQL